METSYYLDVVRRLHDNLDQIQVNLRKLESHRNEFDEMNEEIRRIYSETDGLVRELLLGLKVFLMKPGESPWSNGYEQQREAADERREFYKRDKEMRREFVQKKDDEKWS